MAVVVGVLLAGAGVALLIFNRRVTRDTVKFFERAFPVRVLTVLAAQTRVLSVLVAILLLGIGVAVLVIEVGNLSAR